MSCAVRSFSIAGPSIPRDRMTPDREGGGVAGAESGAVGCAAVLVWHVLSARWHRALHPQAARALSVSESTPVVLELMTYRMGHHTTSDDSSLYRPEGELESWEDKSPLDRFRKLLEAKGKSFDVLLVSSSFSSS